MQSKTEQRQKAAPENNLNRWQIAKRFYWSALKKRAQKELKPTFDVDADNETGLAQFTAWITSDNETMQSLGINPKKGLLVRGNTGSGKSILFRTWKDCRNNENIQRLFRSVEMIRCEDVAKQYQKGGEPFIERYTTKSIHFYRGNANPVLYHRCFDDLGDEEAKNNYGNYREVMKDVIETRYEHFIDYGLLTHFTTNLDMDDIEKRYGSRARSRIMQMCNIIDIGTSVTAKDRRI